MLRSAKPSPLTLRLIFSALALIVLCVEAAVCDSFWSDGAPKLSPEAERDSRSFPHFSELVKVVAPGVVNISVEGSSTEAETENRSPFPPKLDSPMRSLGSGFIVNDKGFIVTNNHVISGAARVVVRLLDDKQEYEAKTIGVDTKTDLALIKIEAGKPLTPVFLGDSDQIEVGEWVMAIGNQFQLGQTVTVGIVSAKARRVPANLSGPYDAFIQTDASINPGSSGGPLVNTRGQVIGINTAIFSPGRSQFGATGFNIGIGFSIPMNMVKSVISQLKDGGKVVRGLLGVKIQLVTQDVAELLGLKEAHGALVADIMPDTPASRAGFERKDVIVKFNDRPVREYEDLPLMVANTPIGSEVEVEVIRKGKPKSIQVKIEELKEQASPEVIKKVKADRIGLVVEDLSQDKLASLNLATKEGAYVSKVEEGSVAFSSGIDQGDVIEELAGEPILNAQSYAEVLKKLPKGKPAMVIVRKSEGSRILTLKIKD